MLLPSRHLDVAYDSVGSGPLVVLLHAFPLSRRMWAPQLHALARGYRVIAPDLRGFGQSGIRGPYSMDSYADDVAALMEALGGDPGVIVGISMGGYIALAFWRRHPTRVRGLVLADTRAGPDSAEGRERRRALIAVARERGATGIADLQLRGLLGKTTRESHPEIVEGVRRIMLTAPAEGIIGATEAMLHRPDSSSTLATIDVPTLVIVGEEDVLTPPAEARAIHSGIRDSRLELIPGAGHLTSCERPSAFNQLIDGFVGDVLRT